MRIRPDGLELLQAARIVIETAIVPNLTYDLLAAARAIDGALAFAEQRLMRDEQPTQAELAELEEARATMRGKLLEALPQERRYDARLVAKAIAVAMRQLANGRTPDLYEYERLAALLDAAPLDAADPGDIRCALAALNERLGARIRSGEADSGTNSHDATLAHLEAVTNEALSESNPAFPRRISSVEPPRGEDTPRTPQPATPVATAFAAWIDIAPAFLRAFRSGVSAAPFARRGDTWLHLNGTVGTAMCASSNLVLTAQADMVGWFADRLAANPKVPMVAVEGAHQAHDVLVAFAEASSELCKFALAPFREVEPQAGDAARMP